MLFEDPIAYVAGASGVVWRVRKLSLLDLPAESRTLGVAALPIAAEAAPIAERVREAQEALQAAEASGDAQAQAAARDALETAQHAAAHRLRTMARDLARDGSPLRALAERNTTLALAAVTGAAEAPDVPPGPVSAADAAGLAFVDVQLVERRDDEEQAPESGPVRVWVGRFDGDVAAIAAASRWQGGASERRRFRGGA